MNYKVGDTVVCVDAKPLHSAKQTLVRGREYIVLAIHQSLCVIVNDGHRKPGKCHKCGETDALWHRYPWRFIKLPKVTARTEVTSEAEAI